MTNLFCLPFAGGGRYSYDCFAKALDGRMNMVAIDLPGRGNRHREPLLSDIPAMVLDVYEQLKNRLHQPYVLYGHSMGTLIGYLLTHHIQAMHQRLPNQLIVTGRSAPSVMIDRDPWHALDLPTFINRLRSLGGCPEEVFQEESLLHFFEPILRADFKAVETYRYDPPARPLNVPITVITGDQEPYNHEHLEAWQRETTYPLDLYQLPGKHFFIFDYADYIINLIDKKIHPKTLLL